MKTKISNSGFIAVLIALLFGVGCGGRGEKKEATKEKEVIKIGATLDFTGPNALYGKQVKDGIDLAVGEINSKGSNIEIDYQDSKSDAASAITNAQKFISVSGIKVIIGEIASSATKAMIPTVEQSNAFLFAPASSSPELTNISKNFARNWPSDLAEAGSAVSYARNNLKANNAAILYVTSDYGIGLKNKFEEEFTKLGGKIANFESFSVDANDFKTLLLKIRLSKVECIYLAGNPKEMGRCIKQMRELKINNTVISNTGFLQDDCLTLAGNAAEGVIIPSPSYNPKDKSSEKISGFYNSFMSKYKAEPTMVNANAYDAVYLIAEAVQNNGMDGLKIANYIRNKKNFNGAAGKVNFTNGDVEVPISFKIIKNGKAEHLIQK